MFLTPGSRGKRNPRSIHQDIFGNLPQLHLSKTALDSGLYLSSNNPSNGLIASGAAYTGADVTAKATQASGIVMSQLAGGDFGIISNLSLTPGVAYSPTYRFYLDTTGHIGIGTTSPNASALLDLTATDKGFAPPRMTTTQRDAITSPVEGLVIYNTTTKTLNFFNGTAWFAPQRGWNTPGTIGHGDSDFLITEANFPLVQLTAGLTADRFWSLPVASTAPIGVFLVIQDGGALGGAFKIRVQTQGSDTFTGVGMTGNKFDMNVQYQSITVITNGANWFMCAHT